MVMTETVYAPIAINPACPSENNPVKPFNKFIETATIAKIALRSRMEMAYRYLIWLLSR